MSHDTLENHYRTNFAMMKHHGYSLADLDEMYPFERVFYTGMLRDYLDELKELRRQQGHQV